MSTADQQAMAAETAARFFGGQQSGPRPNTKEGAWLAARLKEAGVTLRLVAQHRAEFAAIVRAGGQ